MPGKRRRSQFGSVRKLPSGRWQARYVAPGTDRWVNAPMTYTTKLDAQTWLSIQRADLARGTWRPPAARGKALTVSAYAEQWLAHRQLRPRTAAHYRRIIDRFILPDLGTVPLTRLSPEVVRAWHARLDTGDVYRAHAYAVLRTMMRTAVEDRLIDQSPCVLRNTASRRSGEITLPTLAELRSIVDNTPPEYRVMVQLAAWCGLRFGELAELRRKDIDLRAGIIRVRRSVIYVGGAPVVGPPKSTAGVRDVAVPPHLLPALHEHVKGRGADELLFPSRTGRPMRHQAFWPYWCAARDAAGRPDLHFHHLRHHAAVQAARAGATTKELMVRLGHSTPTMSIAYQHAAQDRDAEIAARLSRLADSENH